MYKYTSWIFILYILLVFTKLFNVGLESVPWWILLVPALVMFVLSAIVYILIILFIAIALGYHKD